MEIDYALKRMRAIKDVDPVSPSTIDLPIEMHFSCGGNHWYAVAYDGENTFLGFVQLNGHVTKWGYFTHSGLQAIRGTIDVRVPGGDRTQVMVEVEWDEHWGPQTRPTWIFPSIFPVENTLKPGVQFHLK